MGLFMSKAVSKIFDNVIQITINIKTPIIVTDGTVKEVSESAAKLITAQIDASLKMLSDEYHASMEKSN